MPGGKDHYDDDHGHHGKTKNVDSLTYVTDESDAWRGHVAIKHMKYRGRFWNEGKYDTLKEYSLIAMVGVVQASIAYFANISSSYFIKSKYSHVYHLLQDGHTCLAFLHFVVIQLFFAAVASVFVWIEPVSAGSGIPEVKCYLNGIDLPRVTELKTLVCKVLGVVCSVSAGLPVGKEGPMVHSGAVAANIVSSRDTRNDREKRDFIACGAAAGVCTAFSAPIGGILFSLEEGSSFWGPSLTWKAFFCSMSAISALYILNSFGSAFGKVGFNKLFSFGNFIFEGGESSFAVNELVLFVVIGVIGGLIGAVFNNTNERITHWRIKNVNHSKKRRIVEVLLVSLLVSVTCFLLPLIWTKCTPLPYDETFTEEQIRLVEELVPFRCVKGKEYNEVASLIFTDPGDAIRQLFHLHQLAFSPWALFLFFIVYITLAVVVYGIAVPSGLFVPCLLSGAAFGRLFGNLAKRIYPNLAFSNTYALVGAAAVLGGIARMTISLTVILLECTGNEQFVLPLMLTLMTARMTGSLFNEDLYHIHIHLKKGVNFLDAELRSFSRHHDLVAGQIMGENVVFVKPVEKVGVIYDILKSCKHSNFPVVDKDDGGILFGTISKNTLGVLLKERAFGQPPIKSVTSASLSSSNYLEVLQVGAKKQHYMPIVQWEQLEKSYPKYPTYDELRMSQSDRDCYVDLRPYSNTSPVTVQEFASVDRSYEIFRSLGIRFLPVVNKYNQVVGTITRSDLTSHALAETLLKKGKKHA